MKKFLCLMFLCLLPLTALAENAVLGDSVSFWDAPVYSRVENGLLWMTVDNEPLQPVAVKDGFVEAVRALEAKGEHTVDPDGMHESLKALLSESLTGGMTVQSMDVHSTEIILLLEGPGDGRTLRIAEWNGAGYNVLDNMTFPADCYLDTVHFSDGEAFVWVHETEDIGLSFLRHGDEWRLSLVQNNAFWRVEWSAIADMDKTSLRRNDGYYYGTISGSWTNLATLNAREMPLTLESALGYLYRTGWAVVNNPNPNDRLHLRTKPDRNAQSLGKFYNRTPVRVIGQQGAWSQVIIGENGLTGWMMTQYLTFGKDADSVACAFPNNVELIGAWDETRIARYARATPDMKAPETFEVGVFGQDELIIGVVEDQWYIVMNPDGQVGYVPQSWYGEGNG